MSSPQISAIAPDDSASVTAIIAMPVGTVISYAGPTAPDGWLLCNGQAISSATYPALNALIGNNVPDLQSRFIVGAGQGAGLSTRTLMQGGGEENHTLIISEIPSHTHGFGVGGGGGDGAVRSGTDSGYSRDFPAAFANYTTSAGGDGAHNNMPPFYALTYIIKY